MARGEGWEEFKKRSKRQERHGTPVPARAVRDGKGVVKSTRGLRIGSWVMLGFFLVIAVIVVVASEAMRDSLSEANRNSSDDSAHSGMGLPFLAIGGLVYLGALLTSAILGLFGVISIIATSIAVKRKTMTKTFLVALIAWTLFALFPIMRVGLF